MADELYRLNDGRVIQDKDISDKMFKLEEKLSGQGRKIGEGYVWDEKDMAELFADCYENDTRFCPEAKSWFTYKDGAWRKDVEALLVAEKVKEFVRLLILYGVEVEEGERADYLKRVAKMGGRRWREQLVKDAASVNPIHAAEFDAHPYLINCKNGVYDLERLQFREHDWKDFLTMQTNFEYTVQDVEYPRWGEFINEVTMGDREKADYLQKALGYSMLGQANEECMFILHGKTTRNGKSTLLSAIHHLLGDYASVSPVSIICKSDRAKNAEAATPVLASLKGKRFVTMAESNQYGRLDEEAIKQLTGGEEIKTRNLYETAATWLPQFTLWLSCNDLPAVNDKSLFASDRVRVIEFNRHFSPEEQDKGLKREFQTPKAMQGIFAWLVAGYFKYPRFGLVMPDSMRQVVQRYERDNDLVLQFLEEKCERESNAWIRQKALYDAYKIWCKSNGYFINSAKRFNAELNTHPEWHEGKATRDGYPIWRELRLKGESV
ncbi:MAG: phage/plasmid primase, P4 family [Oscillospiraceae bacterium]|nr:phage/plasmid primase, P4 family [Oscillospiraceae bacterium]